MLRNPTNQQPCFNQLARILAFLDKSIDFFIKLPHDSIFILICNHMSDKITKDLTKQNLITLKPSQLKRLTDPSTIAKNSSLITTDNAYHIGQQRACRAILTALQIGANGYHIFASGENGLGKRTLITKLLSDYVKNRPSPKDWVYVHNFADPRSPIALQLDTGLAIEFSQEIKNLWLSAKRVLNQRFRSEHYQAKVEAIKNQTSLQEEQAYQALNEEGKQFSLTLSVRAFDNKPIFVPTPNDEVELQKPNKKSKKTLAEKPPTEQSWQKNHMHKRLSLLTIALEKIENEANQRLQALHRSLAKRSLTPLFEPLFTKYQDLPKVHAYLSQIFDDMMKNVEHIVNEDDDEFLPSHFSPVPARYFVNVVASHEKNAHAPIVFEDLPTHLNLLGHVEQITHLGTVSTDVSLIRAGSLHRANGGYLILQASNLLEYPYAWQGLKRALQSRQIKMSSLEQMLTLTGSISLEPQSIPLDVKVILLGEPDLYYDLLDFEPEFNSVFKIRADFHDTIARTVENEQLLLGKIADMIGKYQLLAFDNTALASVLDYLSEQAEDQTELSLHSDRLIQILLESNRYAVNNQQKFVNHLHIKQAIAEMQYRSGYLRQLFWQELEKGQQLISTTGQAVGQVNALTVISYADSEFGMPARLTASVHYSAGSGDIVDIERDVDLGGSIHAKGVLIMSSYLKALFAEDYSLNFSASLAFEQSYGGIDGDSATIAEACALLSALAEVPIFQNLAVTGSMNQFGQVQAVGGVNAKIAGFFDACLEKGLTGNQGVIMPKANLNQLMLRDDIIQTVSEGKFHIFAIEHIDEALQLLTQMDVNTVGKKGKFKKNTLYHKIHERLANWEAKSQEK